jgi:DnaK suppressor protein
MSASFANSNSGTQTMDTGDRFAVVRALLMRERDTVLARMAAIERDARAIDFDTDGVPGSDYGREQALTRVLDSRLNDIDGALARIDLGTYGSCATCGCDIPPRRLEALPFATLCVPCQGAADKRRATPRPAANFSSHF